MGSEGLSTGQEDSDVGTLEEYATVLPFKVAMKEVVRSGVCAGRGRGPGSRQWCTDYSEVGGLRELLGDGLS